MPALRVDTQDDAHPVQPGSDVVTRALRDAAKRPEVTSFFDEPTNTATHVVWNSASGRCAVIGEIAVAAFGPDVFTGLRLDELLSNAGRSGGVIA
jgi:hypothetical protein